MAWTETQVKTAISAFLALPDELRKFLYINATNYLGVETTFLTNLRSNFGDSALQGMYLFRGRLNSAMSDGALVVAALMNDMGAALNLSGSSLAVLLEQLRIYYAENTRRVLSRNFTRGTPSAAGGNTGSGAINRLTVDEYGFDIEVGWAEALSAECIQDVGEGARKHEEVFLIEGSAPDRDNIRVTGTGISPNTPSCISARESLDVMANCSWDVYQGSASAPDSITNWTPTSDIANFAIDTTKYYRDYEGATAPASLKILDDDELTQLFTVRRYKFVESVPMYHQVAVNRDNSGFDGNFTFTVGNVDVTVAAASMPANAWLVVQIAIGIKNWYKNFNKTDASFKVGVSGMSTGHLLVDDGLCAPWRRVKGTWMAPVGGSTKFLMKDSFTYTDSAANDTTAVIQWFLSFFFGVYLPATTHTTSVTWAYP